MRGRPPPFGGQATCQGRECQRLREGELVHGLTEAVGTHGTAGSGPQEHVLQVQGIEQGVASGHRGGPAPAVVPGVPFPIGLRLQPGIGDALLDARRAHSVGGAGGGSVRTTRTTGTAQADRGHGCQRRRRRRGGRAQPQVGGQSIVVELVGVLDGGLIRRGLCPLQRRRMFHSQGE